MPSNEELFAPIAAELDARMAENGRLNVDLAETRAALITSLDAFAGLDQVLLDTKKNLATANHVIEQQEIHIAQLEQELAACQAGDGPPAPLFGISHWWPGSTPMVGKVTSYADEYAFGVQHAGVPDIVRCFANESDGRFVWPAIDTRQKVDQVPAAGAVWLSVKPTMSQLASGALTAALTESFRTIPPDVTVMCTAHHEPESKVIPGQYTALDWMRGQVEFAKAVHAVGNPRLTVGPIFMSGYHLGYGPVVANLNGWMRQASITSHPDGGTLLDQLRQGWDFVGWDPYHVGSKSGNVTGQWADPAFYFGSATTPEPTSVTNVKLPFDFNRYWFPNSRMAIGETGFEPQPDRQARARWLTKVIEWARANQVQAVCYWDASTSDTGTPFFLFFWSKLDAVATGAARRTNEVDVASAAAWGAGYNRQ